jgi:hydroxyacid-oxoacid transhydrogenase
MRKYATPVDALPTDKEYAFEVRSCLVALKALNVIGILQVAASNLRFGEGVTREVGMDFKNMKARKVRHLRFSTSKYDIKRHSR